MSAFDRDTSMLKRWQMYVGYLITGHPNGVTEPRYRQLLRERPAFKALPWRPMRRDPQVLCRGKVRHPDHATLRLRGWHRVVPNTEAQAPWISNMSFID